MKASLNVYGNIPLPGSYGGSASVGGRSMRMKSSSAGTFCHEPGHNLGVWHANYWLTTPPSFIGPGKTPSMAIRST